MQIHMGEIISTICSDSEKFWHLMKTEVCWKFSFDLKEEGNAKNIQLVNEKDRQLNEKDGKEEPVILEDYVLNMENFESLQKQALQSSSSANNVIHAHLPQLGALLVYHLLNKIHKRKESAIATIFANSFGFKIELKPDRGKSRTHTHKFLRVCFRILNEFFLDFF